MKVENMTSSKGNKVANQFIITAENGQYFQSYKSIIAFWPNHSRPQGMADGSHRTKTFYEIMGNKSLKDCGLDNYPEIYLDETYWDYSKTTGKYRNIFLGENKAETQKKIDSGEYILTDLN
ncbi:hypothetical protein LCGC14_1772170 [marine sediment metagenome]|uniref:Uncharacterized protein n=1 Tax=marine sediment metagenome TaxID=412755 RepID=A0A0F9JCT0_9ZZZZ